ncbi:hypothetical protein ZIOFF_057271 [Zingiber officinale]|uniref:Glutamyl/glutaminyl-tRNA synthetase class Ib catalytic domain-containing protein n=1 Tax=Zingiber officinale TaxID=94328 RepID=A0A8J5F3F7_ZINOF|nr:hypothetical protein ZIOFF_057271 [Zingiber officinale]
MSDYFQELYNLAVELIHRGLAYVDQVTPEEVKEYREKKMNSPWRDRPIAESLKLFKDMKRVYRIKFAHHPQVGDKWCIYPSYDYSHCIVDSLENVTHSLCSLEFGIRRPSYYWLLVALGLYQAYVWEYSRLNVTNTVMSKRKLKRLVTEKWVDGWDDPCLMTLAGLRRRGVSSTAINSFIRGTGITRRFNSRQSSGMITNFHHDSVMQRCGLMLHQLIPLHITRFRLQMSFIQSNQIFLLRIQKISMASHLE